MRSVNRQYPGLLRRLVPSAGEARRLNRELGVHPAPGQTHQQTRVVAVPDELHGAVCVLAKKLAKGVFYRETGQIFPLDGCLLLNWFTNADLFRHGTYVAFDLLKNIVGDAPPTTRGATLLGDQFEYKFSLSENRSVFVLQARFGGAFGLIVFGSSLIGLLEGAVARIREQTARDGPFVILQSNDQSQLSGDETRSDRSKWAEA